MLGLGTLLLTGVTVTLPAEAEVRGTTIELGAIAQLQGPAEDVARLADFELGYAPGPGYTRLLERDLLQARLASQLPGVKLSWAGSDSCRVAPLTETISGLKMTELARVELSRLFSGEDIELSLERGAQDAIVPAGEQPATLVPVLQGRTLRGGTWSVPIQVLVDGSVYQTVWTSFDVAFWQTRPVLAMPVPRGTALEPAMFEERRVRVHGSSQGGPILQPSALEAAIAVRDLAAGMAVTATDVQRPMVVQRGDLLTLEVRRGNITARTKVYARTSGRTGERIPVLSQENGREMRALVISSEIVRISLD